MRVLKPLFEAGREPVLDGLRAWAILLVLGTHIAQQIPGLSLVWWKVEWATPLYNGWTGVDLFFVLSGFLVGGQVYRAFEKRSFSFVHFYARRSLRIMPAYFSVLAVVALLWFVAPGSRPYLNLYEELSFVGVLKNVCFLTDYAPADMGIGSWSLSIEEQFYLLIPIVFTVLLKARRSTKLLVFMLMVLAALVARMVTYRYYDIGPGYPQALLAKYIYFPFHTRMDALAVGVGAYILHEAGVRSELAVACLRFLGLLLAGFVLLTGAYAGGWLETTLQYTVLCLGFGAILLGTLNDKGAWLARFLSKAFWVPVARLSYSIYLVHILVIHAVSYAFNGLDWPVLMALSMGLGAFAVALPLHLLIETPLHRFAQRRYSLSRSR